MRFLLILILLFPYLVLASPGEREEFEQIEIERVKGFYQQQKEDQIFQKQRLSDVDDIKKNKQLWEKMLSLALKEYLVEKAKEKAPLDESSPQYKADLREKQQFYIEHENRRKLFVSERDRIAKMKKTLLDEATEYDLNKNLLWVERSKRRFSMPLAKAGEASGSAGGYSPSASGSTSDFSPPPPPPPTDFFEPDIPPPPPMDTQPFEDGLPPPIFDEPEF